MARRVAKWVFGCCFLAVVVVVVLELLNDLFLGRYREPEGLAAEYRVTWRRLFNDLKREGRREIGGVCLVLAPILAKEFPDYCFVQVASRRKRSLVFDRFTGSSSWQSSLHCCALPLRDGDTIWCTSSDTQFAEFGSFLRANGRKIESEEDAILIRDIFAAWDGFYEGGKVEQVETLRWRIRLDPDDVGRLEINVEPNGLIKNARFIWNQSGGS